MAQTDGVLSLIIKLSCSLEQDTFLNFFYSRATSSQLYFSLLILCLPTSNTVCEQILGQDARKVEGPQGFSEGSSVAPCGVSPHMLCWLQALAVKEAAAGGWRGAPTWGFGVLPADFSNASSASHGSLSSSTSCIQAMLSGEGAREQKPVMSYYKLKQQWCQDCCCHLVRLGL